MRSAKSADIREACVPRAAGTGERGQCATGCSVAAANGWLLMHCWTHMPVARSHAPRRPAALPHGVLAQYCARVANQGRPALCAFVVCLLSPGLARTQGADAQHQQHRQMPATGRQWPYGPAGEECLAVLRCRGAGLRHVLAQDDFPEHGAGQDAGCNGLQQEVATGALPAPISTRAFSRTEGLSSSKPFADNHHDAAISFAHTTAASTAAAMHSDREYMPPSASDATRAEQSQCVVAAVQQNGGARTHASEDVPADAGTCTDADDRACHHPEVTRPHKHTHTHSRACLNLCEIP